MAYKHEKPEKKVISNDCELTTDLQENHSILNIFTNIDDIPIINIDGRDAYDLRGLSPKEAAYAIYQIMGHDMSE